MPENSDSYDIETRDELLGELLKLLGNRKREIVPMVRDANRIIDIALKLLMFKLPEAARVGVDFGTAQEIQQAAQKISILLLAMDGQAIAEKSAVRP